MPGGSALLRSTALKLLVYDRTDVEFEEIFLQLEDFHLSYRTAIERFLNALFEVIDVQEEGYANYGWMAFLLSRLDASYFTVERIDKLFSKKAL